MYLVSGVTRMTSYVRHPSRSLLSSDIFGSTQALNYGNRSCASMAWGSCLCCIDVFSSIYVYIWYLVETLCYIVNVTSVTKQNFHTLVHVVYSRVTALCCGYCIQWAWGSGSGSGAVAGGAAGSNSGVLVHHGIRQGKPPSRLVPPTPAGSVTAPTPAAPSTAAVYKSARDDKGRYRNIAGNEEESAADLDEVV